MDVHFIAVLDALTEVVETELLEVESMECPSKVPDYICPRDLVADAADIFIAMS